MAPSTASTSRFRPSSTLKKTHIGNQPFTWANWYEHIAWINAVFVVGIPLFGIYPAFSTPLLTKTAIWAFAYYFVTGLGITVGYHRLWSHTSHTATLPVQIILTLLGGGAIQAQYDGGLEITAPTTDTLIPSKIHIQSRKAFCIPTWDGLVLKQDPQRIRRVDITDLNNDTVVMWQHRNFVTIALSMLGRLKGGLIYAGILRLLVVQQATFCVNSLAHWIGDQPFDDRNSPRDHVITALVTLGEGYHNFHHEFPSDYRNAIQWHQYGPTKWCIYLWKQLGLASNLKTFPGNGIEKGRVQKKIDRNRAELNWGVPEGETLVAIGGAIHDVGGFVKGHPGGKALITSAIGKDATAMFNGGVYNHLNAAHNLLSTMRISVLRGGQEVEAWKRSQMLTKNV
ncbi:putative acyl-CoA desaturase [Rhexocercosporidium sp. MPI-PUGE-AT-0058]|nr:putative acyl-CoA desaturase [Rhexocercosporidium sp. MPI-PUGE-AT-0058]